MLLTALKLILSDYNFTNYIAPAFAFLILETGTCLNGTSEGPGTGLNISEFQLENFWQYGSCLDAACEDYSSCHQCMADHLCGWCSSTEKCTTDYGGKYSKRRRSCNYR